MEAQATLKAASGLRPFFLEFVPTVLSIGAFVLMNMNWAFSNWQERGLLATAYGPLYPGVHALSALTICLVAAYVAIAVRSAPLGVLAGLATVALHELVWANLSLLFYGFNQVVGDIYLPIYGVMLALFLLKGRRFFPQMAAFLFIAVSYYIGAQLFLPVSGSGYNITHGGEVAAILDWVIPSLPWFFMPRQKK